MLSAPVRLTALLLVLVIAATGCHRGAKKGDRPDEGVPVEQLYEKSHKLMQGGNWSGAEASFRRLVAQYPYGPYTEQAMIETAYAQYKAGKHDDAVSSIDRFIRTYPTHRNIAYLYYLRGLANSNRSTVFLRRVWSLDASRRDLSTPHQAYSDFNIVVDRYPNSRYAADARQRMLELRDVFAQHELDNALYYMRRGTWVSAVGRANYLLETYPQSAFQYDAVAVLADSYTHLGNKTLADDARRVLQLNQPDHPWLEGKWPKYPWMIRKLNPFGEKSASTGQRNARLEKKRGPRKGPFFFGVEPRSTAFLIRLPAPGPAPRMLRIQRGCDAGRARLGEALHTAAQRPHRPSRSVPWPHCAAVSVPCPASSPPPCWAVPAPGCCTGRAGRSAVCCPYRASWCRRRPRRPTSCTTAPRTTAASWPKAPALCLPAAAPAGGWPVSWAHGTQGIADRCAPSVSGPTHAERDGRFLDVFLAQGYAVAAADYQGLGSPGNHAYLHVRTAARNAIDMVKASRQYLGTATLSPRWVSVGYSQGARPH